MIPWEIATRGMWSLYSWKKVWVRFHVVSLVIMSVMKKVVIFYREVFDSVPVVLNLWEGFPCEICVSYSFHYSSSLIILIFSGCSIDILLHISYNKGSNVDTRYIKMNPKNETSRLPTSTDEWPWSKTLRAACSILFGS